MGKDKNEFISTTIALLKRHDFYGAGEYTEIAKGKHAIVYSMKAGVNKIMRLFK